MDDKFLNDRIVEYFLSGNATVIRILFDIGLINSSDKFTYVKKVNSNQSLSPIVAQELPPLHIIALNEIPNYIEMIDLLLEKGANPNDLYKRYTPLEKALMNRNYKIAAYLEFRGGIYTLDGIGKNISDPSVFLEFEKAKNALHD